ncbi:MAG TPA: sigma-70 family RNA polymerase sigma factor [Polyangiaceae bacterium]|nr:sigma-70 family RNA polymerase sigma factor [Polyangiaceae bacterium]
MGHIDCSSSKCANIATFAPWDVVAIDGVPSRWMDSRVVRAESGSETAIPVSSQIFGFHPELDGGLLRPTGLPSLTEAPDLLEKARAGDPQAFQALVRPHLDSIRRFARSFCKSEADADDLAQDALVKAYRSFSSFDGRSSLSTWLYSIARHQFLDHRRGKLFLWRRRETELVESDPTSHPNPEALVHDRERVELLWATLRRIDEKFRTPLVLAEIEGLSYEEIATIEGVPIGTVRSRIARAKDQLRQLLNIEPGEAIGQKSGTTTTSATSHPMTRDVR